MLREVYTMGLSSIRDNFIVILNQKMRRRDMYQLPTWQIHNGFICSDLRVDVEEVAEYVMV